MEDKEKSSGSSATTKNASKKNQVPIRKGSWFARAKLTIPKSLLLPYCFANKMTYDRTIHETSISSSESSSSSENGMERYLTTSKRTVADYFSYCREICVLSIKNKLHKDKKIGGIGKVVEIDESKFGKRKYSWGRLVESQWVFGGICRETRDSFLVALPGNKRDRATLEPIIMDNIEPGATITSDCWKAYDNLGSVGFSHLTVNHSYNFVIPPLALILITLKTCGGK